MAGFQVLLIAGTHGNEINAPWLFDQWSKKPDLIKTNGTNIIKVLGNELAYKKGVRYLDRDLNRSFRSDLLFSSNGGEREVDRAKELIQMYGTNGLEPCQMAIDFHTTTASMGNSLVIYGRRNVDLALASLFQSCLGVPIYLHEDDFNENGFLVESWPCGLVVEIGPVSQNLLQANICKKIKTNLNTLFESITLLRDGDSNLPKEIVIHRHIGSIDFPRDEKGHPEALVHDSLQGKDWQLIRKGDALFQRLDGRILTFQACEEAWPVFINEAAYLEKNIAMSITKRETWSINKEWFDELRTLCRH